MPISTRSVITSYSIHYTKLYDLHQGGRPGHAQATRGPIRANRDGGYPGNARPFPDTSALRGPGRGRFGYPAPRRAVCPNAGRRRARPRGQGGPESGKKGGAAGNPAARAVGLARLEGGPPHGIAGGERREGRAPSRPDDRVRIRGKRSYNFV